MYLIATFPSRHYDIEQYPAVKNYLLSFGIERLEQTGKVHNVIGEKVKAREKTNNKWFEPQDSISYWDVFAKQSCQFSALIVLPTSDEIRNGIGTLAVKTNKKIVFTVDTECFRCDGKSNNLQIRESGDYTTARDISLLVDLISSILLADFKYFSELCDKVVHSNDI